MRAARAARLFFLTRPIKFFICGVVVAVPLSMLKLPIFTAKAKESSRFVSVGCCSDEFLWHQENTNTSRKSQRDVSLLKKNFSFEERAERD